MILAVTGFVEIPDHPRSANEYYELGMRLFDTGIPLLKLETDLHDCWLYKVLAARKKPFTHSVDDNPRKNSVAYHCVQAQKSEWVAAASNYCPTLGPTDVLVWIDFGIFSVPGVDVHVIREFMRRAKYERAIAIPGCWSRDYEYDDQHPMWRWCGGVMVIPQRYAETFDVIMKGEYRRWLRLTDNLSWEVNTLSRVEQRHPELPLWWYRADTHDASMFTNYRATELADGKATEKPMRF